MIHGRIITEDLEELPGVWIQNRDTLLIGKTDLNGYFKIEIPPETNKLLLSFIGMEWTIINLKQNCDIIEVVMMYDVIYDFMASRKVNRLRLKRFKELPKLHRAAYENGIFLTEEQCYVQDFNLN
ncbi:hypothetical protein FH5T_19840 [Draconibacterium orientale]|nr:hypothetical protein FH5T_19840 [Draconibacterium orientale]